MPVRPRAAGDVVQNVVRGVVNVHQQGALHPAELEKGSLRVGGVPHGPSHEIPQNPSSIPSVLGVGHLAAVGKSQNPATDLVDPEGRSGVRLPLSRILSSSDPDGGPPHVDQQTWGGKLGGGHVPIGGTPPP